MVLPLVLVGVAVAAVGSAAVAIAATGDDKESENPKEMERRKWRKRRRRLRKQRARLKGGNETLAARHVEDLRGKVWTHDAPRLEMANEAGESFMSIAEVPDPGLVRWEDATGARGAKSGISRLNPLLSAVPNLTVAGNVLATNYMEVVVPAGESLAEVATGNEVFRGFFKGVDGKIKGHAELFKPDQFQRLVSGAVLLNIASVALAQKHLHDISKKLDRISEQLEEVGRFQREERFSNIEGTLREFMQMKREMADYSFAHISTDAVASECIQLSKIERHVRKDVARAIEELESAGGLGAKFDQGLNGVLMLLKELHLCVMAKLYGCQIMAIVSEDPGWLDSRLDDVQDDIERLIGYYESTVKAILDTLGKGKDSQDSLELLSRLRSSDELESIVVSVDNEMATTRELVCSRNAPVSLLLKVNGGEIEGFAVAEG